MELPLAMEVSAVCAQSSALRSGKSQVHMSLSEASSAPVYRWRWLSPNVQGLVEDITLQNPNYLTLNRELNVQLDLNLPTNCSCCIVHSS